ncbi:hypothetical protein [Enterobacter roggenkampii]|uniref:hypothetical protein n=1 Tax=Enterobacter roggenkampii TaxID=1812935 RepID=UPI000A4EF9A1|nr:hypothetical protein [Enterobacter roggenkampii]
MSDIDKHAVQAVADLKAGYTLGHADVEIIQQMALDAVTLLDELEAKDSMIAAQQHEIRTLLNALEGRPCPKCNDTGMADSGGTQPWGEPISVPCDCAAPPSPVAVPAAMEMDDDFDSAFEHGKAVGWNAYRAAMLQGANGTLTNEGTITATQFKPVADLYGLTSPTGSETSFTFDAVEARDFIGGGWSCQEYVELGRYQEALTDHSEGDLDMVRPVMFIDGNLLPGDAEKLKAAIEEFNHSGEPTIMIAGNSPVIPDGWVLVPIEPTEDMIVNGFESEPDESFSDEKEWEAYDAMSGCQQAAHRAKLCWEAMISAAPKPTVR